MTHNDQVLLKLLLEGRRGDLSIPIPEGDFFELFVADQVLKDHDLSWEELESGIVGGGGDGGIDGFYLFVNDSLIGEETDNGSFRGKITIEVHILQAKTTEGFSENALVKMRSTITELLDLSKDLSSLVGPYNQQLLDAFDRFRRVQGPSRGRLPDISFFVYYASQGLGVHPNVERQATLLEEEIRNLYSQADYQFSFVDARTLVELSRQVPTTEYLLSYTDAISTESNAYVCLVRLSDYHRFITDDQGRCIKILFDANVRDYQGSVEVNSAIAETLANPCDEDFWWLNNGITILASQAGVHAKQLSLSNPRIVNGLQTSLEIHEHFSEAVCPEETNRRLLVRVIVPDQPQSYARIIRATNSQTKIPIASLRATDQVHRDIEDYFEAKGLYYERRKTEHKNRGMPPDRIVSISYVAQAVMAVVLARPNDARARPSTVLKDDEDYVQVFSPYYPLGTYLASTRILMLTERFLRAHYGLSRNETNNLKYHSAMYAARYYLKEMAPTAVKVANLDADLIDEQLLIRSIADVQAAYVYLGGTDQIAKGEEFIELVKRRLEDALGIV